MRTSPAAALLLLCVCWAGQAAAQPVPALALTPEQLATLPQHEATITFGNPPAPHRFQGPLLWDVLTSSGTVDPARHADAVRQWIQLRAEDGYTAVLALAEVAPEFENKPALLAIRMDAAMLDRPRMVLPGDKRAGRSVRDVTTLSIESLPGTPAGPRR